MAVLRTPMWRITVLALAALLLAACDRANPSPTELLVPTSVSATHVPPPGPQPTATATRVPVEPSPAAPATSVSMEPSARVEVSPLLRAEQADAVPTACTPDVLRTLFERLVARYNAGDADGIVALMQPEQGDAALDGAAGAAPFLAFGWGNEPAAMTHDELRVALPAVLADGYTMRLSIVLFGPSVDTRLPGGPSSPRNADVSVEMARWMDPAYPQAISGKGTVDCVSGRIIVLAGGPGALGF